MDLFYFIWMELKQSSEEHELSDLRWCFCLAALSIEFHFTAEEDNSTHIIHHGSHSHGRRNMFEIDHLIE